MSDHEHKEGGENHGGGSHGGGGHGGGGHGGGGGHAEGEHEGAPEWLISFADNVALMMGFFVILLAMNMGKKTAGGIGGEDKMGGAPTPEMLDFVIAIRDSFNSPISPSSTKPEEQQFVKRMREKKEEATQVGPRGTHHNLQSIGRGEINKISVSVPFDDRSTLLSSTSRETISQTTASLKDQRWIIEVRGYVSPFECMQNKPRGRQLAYERAMAVAQAMVDSGMQWNTIRVVSMGDSGQLSGRSRDADSARSSQRVEVIVTNEIIDPDPYARPSDVPVSGGHSGDTPSAPIEGEEEPH